VAFDVALIACPVMQFYCGTPMYLLSGVDKRLNLANVARDDYAESGTFVNDGYSSLDKSMGFPIRDAFKSPLL
jgi:hypothetical protein